MRENKTAEEKLKSFKKSNIERRLYLVKKEGFTSVHEYITHLTHKTKEELVTNDIKSTKNNFSILEFIMKLLGYGKN